jgi:hypothetical protein
MIREILKHPKRRLNWKRNFHREKNGKKEKAGELPRNCRTLSE